MWFSRDYLHLWHSWGIVLIKKVTVLSYFPREETRVIALDEYRRRTICANQFPRDACVQHHISFWKLRSFTDSQILRYGVYLSTLEFCKFWDNLEAFYGFNYNSVGIIHYSVLPCLCTCTLTCSSISFIKIQ